MLRKLSSALITLLMLASLSCASQAGSTVTEAGSTTVQPLAEKLAAAFMQEHPEVNIIIQGGGSSVGVKSADSGTVDIGAASRELKPAEPKLKTHLMAMDGIAIVVHPSNEVSGLTKRQVRMVFAGEITDWSQLGDGNGTITVVSREEGSGTRAAFQELIMGKTLITEKAILLPSNGAIVQSMSSTPLAIGFLSLGYLDPAIKSLAIDGVECTPANCRSGVYPVVRPLYFLTKDEPAGLVKEFLDFCQSDTGQRIVEAEGYLRIR